MANLFRSFWRFIFVVSIFGLIATFLRGRK
jgi:hypothetical protein